MVDVRKLKDRAAAHLDKGRFSKAAELLAAVIRAEPRDLASRQKLADALRRAGDQAGAVRVYREVADRYAANGQLIKAVAICKVILEIEPAHHAMQAALASLYARRSSPVRAAPAPEESPSAPERGTTTTGTTLTALPLGKLEAQPLAAEIAPSVDPRVLPAPLESPYEHIVAAAREASAAGVSDPAVREIEGELLSPAPVHRSAPGAPFAPLEAPQPIPDPSRLPEIPLFSDLSREAFVALSRRLTLHRVEAGATIVREGELGTSFFVIAAGRVRVERAAARGPLLLAELCEGSFFGEMAVLSGAERVASVVAEEPCELLEIRADVLEEVSRTYPHVATSLTKFYRQRLLSNALATSPLFRPFGRDDRIALMWRFRSREVQAGEVLVREGEPSEGLFVVLSGEVDVTKRAGGETLQAARLTEGDVFGEMSCLSKGSASATVTARRRTTLLLLPRAAFDEVVLAYPPVLAVVSELGDERRRSLEALMGGRGDDGLVLV
ncbi:MAG TPA: cyclic nucleotide-binding domain-containing protein [Anaeromyxobacteraceae bacterium]|nr:cyclic nucleotide-binding domain-containing protein [Anaeromyxobacteraceae bacterium]